MARVVPAIILVIGSIGFSQERDETKCCCTTYDTAVCLGRIHKQVDAELNNTYQLAIKSVAAHFTPQDLENLKEAERAWASYRDAACKAEYGLWGGGSGGPNAQAMCLIRLTRERIADLKNTYLQDR